ncbi:MAG: transcription antitermination factor NusB [Planctomycetota bacterium]
MPRSFVAGLLNRLETSQHMLDEVLAVEFSKRKEMHGARRHRAKLLAHEVIRRRATLDQILKVYSSRPPENMEHHVRTVLRLALAEWFFVEPIPRRPEEIEAARARQRERPEEDDDRRRRSSSDDDVERDERDDDDRPRNRDRDRERERDDRDRDDRDERRGRGRRRRRRGHHTPEWSDDDPSHQDENMPVARGPIAAAAVNLVGTGRPSRGFVNGVLRAVDRETTYDAEGIIAPGEYPRDRMPAGYGGVYTFRRQLFADPTKKTTQWLAQFCSFNKWLAERFVARYGLDEAVAIGEASNGQPALSARINTRRIQPDELVAQLEAAGIPVTRTGFPEVIRLDKRVPLVGTEWFENGLLYLQDFTATRVAHLAGLEPGMRVLDACAAPGGKITHACELLGGKGTFVACDSSDRRLALLEDNLERLGHDEVDVLCSDLRTYAAGSPEKFDVIFVDAPCSNTGVLSRRAEARWRACDKLQQSLITLQVELLRAAKSMLTDTGRIIYSTCTLEPEENRGVVVQTDLNLVQDWLWLPENGLHDGGYHAVLTAK